MLIDGIYYSDPEVTSYIKKLKNTIAMNEESQKIADGVIEQLKQENKDLKETLKQVADDIETFRIKFKESKCNLGCAEECLFYNYGRDSCEYAHMDEIKKLISDK